MNEQEYTLSEAAKRLAELKGKSKPFTRQYIHKLCKEGILKHRKVGQDGSMLLTTESALVEASSIKRKVGRPKN